MADEGEDMARAWLAGKTNMHDDLGELVASMVAGELGPVERGFLRVVGDAARSTGKRKGKQTAEPVPQPPPAGPVVDVDASWRRARERMKRARLEELARRNAQIPIDGGSDFWRQPNREWDGT
jgi:hypothetical protein